MLIKTDYTDTIKHAKITLMCELRPAYYTGRHSPDFSIISMELKELEYGFISPNGEAIMTLSSVMPVGCYTGYNIVGQSISPQPWLIIEIAEAGKRHEDPHDWEDFLAKATTKIVQLLAINGGSRIATVEYDGDKRFVVMDDISGCGDEEIYA